MVLFLPIKPEPAARIRSGVKWFELRKARPPATGLVYLLETSDETARVDAIRTAIVTEPHISLPLEALWDRVGTFATSKKRFDSYFGSKYRYGVAIPISETQLLAESVTASELNAIDPNFAIPNRPWTYYEVPDDSPAALHLGAISRADTLHAPAATGIPDLSNIKIEPLESESDENHFRELYRRAVEPYYRDTDGYIDRIVQAHESGMDRFGYFTRRKDIWVLKLNKETLGFTVATVKRGGSVKFGPTMIEPLHRGSSLGSAFRLLVEARYPEARKFYNTMPAKSDAALRYALNAGYQVEAHLVRQYGLTSDDLVVGKVPVAAAKGDPIDSLPGVYQVAQAASIDEPMTTWFIDLLAPHYGDLGAAFVEGIERGLSISIDDLGRKPKRLLLANAGALVVGACVLSPKRGGAFKIGPIAAEDRQAVQDLLTAAVDLNELKGMRKAYIHVPLLESPWLEACLALGFRPEGILREPYKSGVDLVVLGRLL